MVIPVESENSISHIARILKEGGVAVLPCDTIYGLVGIAPGTEEKIARIKGRPSEKRFITLVESAESVKKMSSENIEIELLSLWPGPLTLIIPVGSGARAVRVPDDAFLIDVIRSVGPIYSTSVNRSGEPPLKSVEEISRVFGRSVDLIVDAGTLPDRKPSTILDVTQHPYVLLRDGECTIPETIDVRRV